MIELTHSGHVCSSPSLLVAQVYPPTRKASFDVWLHHTGCWHRGSRGGGGSLPRPLLAVKVNIGIPFHDLCDASSQVLQQSHEVIYLISLHQSNALALIELSYAIQEHIHKLFLFESLIGVDVLCLLPCDGHETTLSMITLYRHFQEERIGYL